MKKPTSSLGLLQLSYRHFPLDQVHCTAIVINSAFYMLRKTRCTFLFLQKQTSDISYYNRFRHYQTNTQYYSLLLIKCLMRIATHFYLLCAWLTSPSVYLSIFFYIFLNVNGFSLLHFIFVAL